MNIFRHFTSNGVRAAVQPESGSGATPTRDSNKGVKTAVPCSKKQVNPNNTDTDEDAELVHKAQAGDSRAFDTLVSKHRGKIYAMILNMVKNDADAWDLAQEAFIKAWRALPKFEGKSRFSTWLFRISHNVVYDWLRKRKIEGDGELNDELFDAQLESAIAKLSNEHREVILLREVQGLDYKEIADITKSSSGTVMSRLYYARKKLQALLNHI